jgi:hypothetical protein
MVRRYTPFDLAMVSEWFAQHKLGLPDPSLLPEFGLIVPDVACGFLYETNSKLAMMDGLIGNMHAGLHERGQAVDDIARGLVEEARNRGFTRVMFLSSLRSVVQRSERHGFQLVGTCHILAKGV